MRERLDVLLVDRGLFASRAQARAAVLAGEITVDDRVVDKPGTQVDGEATLKAAARRRYVSRGGDKLDTALTRLGVGVAGEDVIDLGSSTGGFVDRLLQGGAARVIAVDVGYGQLDWKLREDPRVTVLERTNARTAHARTSPLRALVRHRGPLVHLPDGGPGAGARMPARGLPRSRPGQAAVRGGARACRQGRRGQRPCRARDVLERVADWLQERGTVVEGVCDSGHPGPKGNVEYFILFRDAGTTGATASPAAELVRAAVEAAHG